LFILLLTAAMGRPLAIWEIHLTQIANCHRRRELKNETVDRIATGTITALPFIALGIVCWQLWNDLLHWSDVAVFTIMYLICAIGVTVGFHRHLTHRSFKAKKPVRATWAGCSSTPSAASAIATRRT
jgi:fatty-acid desaturase